MRSRGEGRARAGHLRRGTRALMADHRGWGGVNHLRRGWRIRPVQASRGLCCDGVRPRRCLCMPRRSPDAPTGSSTHAERDDARLASHGRHPRHRRLFPQEGPAQTRHGSLPPRRALDPGRAPWSPLEHRVHSSDTNPLADKAVDNVSEKDGKAAMQTRRQGRERRVPRAQAGARSGFPAGGEVRAR